MLFKVENNPYIYHISNDNVLITDVNHKYPKGSLINGETVSKQVRNRISEPFYITNFVHVSNTFDYLKTEGVTPVPTVGLTPKPYSGYRPFDIYRSKKFHIDGAKDKSVISDGLKIASVVLLISVLYFIFKRQTGATIIK